MEKFVFWTGIISVVSGAGFQFPAFGQRVMPSEQAGMLIHLFGLMAMFLGIMLILCARDLGSRGTLVIWEGVLRLGGFCLMSGYGIRGGGTQMVLGGIFDLAVGLAYLVWMPRHLSVSILDLLLDRQGALRRGRRKKAESSPSN